MRNPPPAAQWLSQIESARSAADLLRVLRDYLASLDESDRAQLPAVGDGNALSEPAAIQEWAVTLARLDLKDGGAPGKQALHEAAMVFASAGTRLAKVTG